MKWCYGILLGHMNLTSLKKIFDNQLVCGIPNIRGDESTICGDCPIGKQTERVILDKVRFSQIEF